MDQRIKVSNDHSSFITLWLEPWGEDYGMFPGDEFEVLALDSEEDFYFHISHDEKGTKVYAERSVESVAVYKGGELLSCGHNRRKSSW